MEKPTFSYKNEKGKKVNLNYKTSERKFGIPKLTVNENYKHISPNNNIFYYVDYQADSSTFCKRLAYLDSQLTARGSAYTFKCRKNIKVEGDVVNFGKVNGDHVEG